MPPQPQSISGPVGLSDSESYYELPGFDTMSETWQNDIVLPKELVSGLIHMGTKTALVGGSKANKTWSLMDLGLSIAYGMPWWGLPTHQGRVLYINFEIPPPFARKRLRMIELAKKPTDNRHRADFVLWNLRGHAAYFALRIDQIAQQIAQGNFAAVIVDPVYKLLGARDENSARDVAQMLNSLEQLLAKSDAALIFGAHTTKGNQAQKEAMDRASGSGVFARDPDTMIILTSHLEPDAFTVDFVLRNFPPKPPFVVRREHPLMVRAADLDPEDLKQARTGQRARKPTPTVEMFLSIFPTKAIGDVVKSSLGNADISRVFKERDWDSGSIKTLKDQASTMGHLVMKPQAHNHQRFILAEVLQVLEAA